MVNQSRGKSGLGTCPRAGLLVLLLGGLLSGCGGPPAPELDSDAGETGIASYYARKFHGRTTANGEIFDQTELTAAHRTLPFGTRVRVTRLSNGRSVTVRINDRGPWKEGRIIDLSRAAAERLGMIQAGLVKVRIDVLENPDSSPLGRAARDQ